MMRRLPPLLLVLLALAFFYQLVFSGLILARGDTYVYFYPYWDARDTALAAGQLPLWTPDLFMGAPLLANPQLGTFYPPNWLTISLDPPDSVRISIVLHVVWAALGTYALARRWLDPVAALVSAVVFAFGGYLGAHVEQINQLQGLSWLPWLFLLLDRALRDKRPLLPLALLGLAWGMQILSGHTQTVFIAGIGLGVYAIVVSPKRVIRHTVLLALAALIALIVASPQLILTQELVSLSNRGGGFNPQQATAFSLPPVLLGRGLLPAYDSQLFGEYVGYVGVIGLELAVMGAMSDHRERWPWLALALVGVLLALGRHNPLYWLLAGLPGFNLFRVPARWLALFALGTALLAGMGVQVITYSRQKWRPYGLAAGFIGLLALTTLLAGQADAELIDGPAVPAAITWTGWALALGAFMVVWWRRSRILMLIVLVIELGLASQMLPYNDLSDPAVYEDGRFTVYQMQAYGSDQSPPGRLLSISDLRFDPGDRAALEKRWSDLNERGVRYAFTATKLQETLAPNLPLTWNVPTIDGFGGGVLPTAHYTAFTSLLLPQETLRTVDGRLREVLAQPECRGACVPEDRWLDLTGTRYLLTDKVYDLVYESIFYDTQLIFPDEFRLADFVFFEANAVHVLYSEPATVMDVVVENGCVDGRQECRPYKSSTQMMPDTTQIDGLTLSRFALDEAVTAAAITINADRPAGIRAVSLVDTRTGNFLQLAPPGWRRVYSADVKIYENLDVMPRAFVVYDAQVFPDTWDGTESALDAMRDPTFDPAQTVTLNVDDLTSAALGRAEARPYEVEIITYTDERVEVVVNVESEGFLVLVDAFYPGWRATVNGERVDILRANVMFRAVLVPAGESMVVFRFLPFP